MPKIPWTKLPWTTILETILAIFKKKKVEVGN